MAAQVSLMHSEMPLSAAIPQGEPRDSVWRQARAATHSLVIGFAGGVTLWLLGWPSPWLIGGMAAAALASLSGLSIALPGPLRSTAFLLLAASMGSAVTPDTFTAMARWPLSIAILLLTVPLLVVLVTAYLHHVANWDRREAVLAAVPGALSFAVAAAADAGLDPRRVAISQTLRLFLVVALLPLAFATGPAAGQILAGRLPDAGALDVGLMLAASVAAALLFKHVAVPAAWMVGGLFGSGLVHATGMVTSALPAFVLLPAMVITGTAIGSRFAGTSWGEIRAIIGHALIAIGLAVGVSAGAAAIASWAIGVPLAQAMLAFAPGGLEAAAILAYTLGYDPAYVATHQLIRFIGIALALPFVMAWLKRT